ncbi:MAG: hypothetical protein ACE5HE_12555 [Phycisphaerae bacterium]
MSGWSIVVCAVVASAGALCFLRVVADAIHDAENALRMLEQREWKLCRQRQEDGENAAATVVPVPLVGQDGHTTSQA